MMNKSTDNNNSLAFFYDKEKMAVIPVLYLFTWSQWTEAQREIRGKQSSAFLYDRKILLDNGPFVKESLLFDAIE